MKRGNSWVIVVFFSSILGLNAQNYSFYFGRKNLISASFVMPLGEYVSPNTVKKAPLDFQLGIETMHGKRFVSGLSLQYTSLVINDVFTNNGADNNYYVKVNQDMKKVNNGSGSCQMKNFESHAMFRTYLGQRSMRPLGTFFGIGAGLSFTDFVVKDNYQYTYSMYYDNSVQLRYIQSGDQHISIFKPYLVAELGKTIPLYKHSLLFSFAVQSRKYMVKKVDDSESLKNRYTRVSNSLLAEYQKLNLKASLIYAF